MSNVDRADARTIVKTGLLASLAAALPMLCGCGLVTMVFGSCLGVHAFQRSAPPVAKTVALVESSPVVAEALGDDVSVSLAIAKIFDREVTRAMAGNDRVRLYTTVSGSRGEAMLDLSAENVDGQGWAGTFSLRTEGRRVLRDGNYVGEGGGTLLEGTYAPDGTPRLAP